MANNRLGHLHETHADLLEAALVAEAGRHDDALAEAILGGLRVSATRPGVEPTTNEATENALRRADAAVARAGRPLRLEVQLLVTRAMAVGVGASEGEVAMREALRLVEEAFAGDDLRAAWITDTLNLWSGDFDHELEIAERVLGADHPALAVILDQRGIGELVRGQLPAALADFDRGIAVLDQVGTRGFHRLGWIRMRRAEVLIAMGRLEDADREMSAALPVLDAAAGREGAAAEAHRIQAEILIARGRFEEAVRHAELAFWLHTAAVLRGDSQLAPAARQVLAAARWGLGDREGTDAVLDAIAAGRNLCDLTVGLSDKLFQSLELRRRLLALAEATFAETVAGMSPLDHGVALDCLGQGYYELGDFDTGIARYQRARTVLESAFEQGHEQLARTIFKLAEGHFNAGRLDDAEVLYERSGRMFERLQGAVPSDVPCQLATVALFGGRRDMSARAQRCREARDEMILLAWAHWAAGDYAEARKAALEVLAARGHAYSYLDAHDLLTDIFARDGQLAEALEHNRRASELLVSEFASFAVKYWRGIALGHAARWREAIPLLEVSAATVATVRRSDRHPDVFFVTLHLGKARLGAGDAAGAVSTLRPVVEYYETCCADGIWTADARWALARALVVSGKDRARARLLAERARATFAEWTPGRAPDRDAVDDWLDETASDP